MPDAVKSAESSTLRALEPYVPVMVRDRLARDPTAVTGPALEFFSTAVLFVDISGFTFLAEDLAQHGSAGAERLKEVLDVCFGRLVELINAFGGDVIKFPGDGALVVWRVKSEESLASSVRLASRCGLSIQENLDVLEPIPGVRLRFRIAVTAGSAFVASVGGEEGHWQLLVGGQAFDQIAPTMKQVAPGEVVTSPEAWALLDASTAKEVEDGYRVLQRTDSSPVPTFNLPQIPPEAETALRQYIPPVVQTRIEAGQADWLAEFRSVTMMFVNVYSVNFAAADLTDSLQAIATCLQKTVYRFGGGVNEFLLDDKGLTLVAGWGQSLATHDDDPVRACQAAIQAQRELENIGLECGIGLATGIAFVGTRGGVGRAEYATVGPVVNLAARLATNAHGAVLCDSTTRLRSRYRMIFESLPAILVKGKTEPVAVFRPVRQKERLAPGRQPFFGRQPERFELGQRLDILAQHNRGGVVVIAGDAGIGKSRMVADLIQQTQVSRVRSLIGAAEDVGRASAYFAWQSIFHSLLRFDHLDEHARRSYLINLLDPEQRPFVSILNSPLRTDFPENPTIGKLTAEARAELTRTLLIDLLRKTIRNDPTMIVIEDAHWLDSASWALAEGLHLAAPELLLIISMRPFSAAFMPVELRRMLEEPTALKITLKTLEAEEALALMCDRLGVDSLPTAVARVIQEKAEGHPFFTEQLAYELRDSGVIRIADGECITTDASLLRSALLPETVQAVIRERIDRLTQRQQLTLKVASVLGRGFKLNEIERIHPIRTHAAELREQMVAAVQTDLLQTAPGESSYSFKHAITQEVVYGMLAFAQRRQLHRATAEWLEQEYETDLAQVFPLLAHHWAETEVTTKALEYLEKAGESALATFSNPEAVHFFSRAIDRGAGTEEESSNEAETLRKARWHRRKGEALWRMGDFQGSVDAIKKSLDLVGYPIADSTLGRVKLLLGHMVRQTAHLLFPDRFVEQNPDRRARLSGAAEAASQYAWINIVHQDSLGLMTASLASVNWAQKAARQSVIPLAVIAYTLGSLKFQRLARRYFSLARTNAVALKQFHELGWSSILEGLNLMGVGQISQCIGILDEGFQVAQGIGDREVSADLTAIRAIAAGFQGQTDEYLKRSLSALDLLTSDSSVGKPLILLTAAFAQCRLSRPSEARAFLEEYKKRIEEIGTAQNKLLQVVLSGLEAAVYTSVEDWQRAKNAADYSADWVLKTIGSQPPSSCCYDDILRCYVEFWERFSVEKPAESAKAARAARRILRYFACFAWKYPVYKPRYMFFRGQVAWLKGRRTKAIKTWRRGLQLAEELLLPLEQGFCHYELGRRSFSDSPFRKTHLEKARELFAQCQVPFYVDKVDQLLMADRN